LDIKSANRRRKCAASAALGASAATAGPFIKLAFS
jgi:hypothetical protein